MISSSQLSLILWEDKIKKKKQQQQIKINIHKIKLGII